MLFFFSFYGFFKENPCRMSYVFCVRREVFLFFGFEASNCSIIFASYFCVCSHCFFYLDFSAGLTCNSHV